MYWHINGHSDVVYNLAEFDQVGLGVVPTANVGITYGGHGFTNTGPLRILQNDWFVPGSDFDGDGLGHTLEQSLGTCDRPWAGSLGDTMPDGRSCNTLQFCDTRADWDEISTCNAQLRDTDHDGLRDDIEVYGYDEDTTHMARYGANPVHKDVFVELNTRDTDPSDGDCDGFSNANVQNIGNDGNFFTRVAALYSQAPATMNPDGTAGISVHYDVGVANPNPLTASLWGDWGAGGQCFSGMNFTPQSGQVDYAACLLDVKISSNSIGL